VLRSTLSRAAPRRFSTAAAIRRVPIFQIDSFAAAPFEGNPAAVCPLDEWLSDEELCAVAAENNLSETAFMVARPDGDWNLRWFTPIVEVDCCGHGTLAAGAVVLGQMDATLPEVSFHTKSGELVVRRAGLCAKSGIATYTLDFPLWPCDPVATPPPTALVQALGGGDGGLVPLAAHAIAPMHAAPYYLFEYASEAHVRALAPVFSAMEANVVATAPAAADSAFDVASRWFGPCSGINEDPVTGSAHCTLAPYWFERLGKTELLARQVSKRGGTLHLALAEDGERLLISGPAALYMEGVISLPPVG